MEFLGDNKLVNNTKPLVSVCIQVYNNEEYIEECLNSILSQQTNFNFEIIVGEDESTDNTREICKRLAENNQDKIRLFLRKEQDKIYHKGKKTSRFNYMSNLKASRGKYIALCDGDDYWIDNNKLQKQVNILDENEGCVASHHWQKNSVFVNESWVEVASPKGEEFGYSKKKIGDVCDIFNNKLRLKARTLMFRNIIDENFFPSWFTKVAFADVSLSFLLGKYGEFHFMKDEMAVYRQTKYGLSKSGLEELGFKKFKVEHMKNYIEIWDRANEHYNYFYYDKANKTVKEFYKIIIAQTGISFKSLLNLIRYTKGRRLERNKLMKFYIWLIWTFFKLKRYKVFKRFKNFFK